jgi:hypothetical protein
MASAQPPRDPRQAPPWPGPPFEPVTYTRGPVERPSEFPFKDPSQVHDLFPPVCLRTHWDPTRINRWTLPEIQVATPLDPRPYTKVCLNYVTSQEFQDAPRPPDGVVYPMGGTVYPPTRYRESVDQESMLRRLDRPLGTCEKDQYLPPRTGDMYRPNVTVPDKGPSNDRFIEELAFPQACMRAGPYPCRAEAEKEAWYRSPRPFNNTTKQDRYIVSRPDLSKPQPVPQPIADYRVAVGN